jgi:hypothetical protein
MSSEPQLPTVALHDWLGRLERQFVEAAVRLSRRDAENETAEAHADRALVERIDRDIAMVHRALELCRKHDL